MRRHGEPDQREFLREGQGILPLATQRTRRFYLPPEQCAGPEFALSERDAHHARDTLRLRMGDAVMVLDGAGGVIECAVRVLARREVVLAVQERRQTPRPACGIVLYQGISKGKAMDWIVQKATELGAVRIVPVLAERSVPQWDGGAGAARRDRWESVAIEALKQCGSPWLPAIEPPQPTAAVLAHHRLPELTLIAAFGAEARPIRCWFDEFKRQQGRLPDAAGVWVGPEGDFTAAEVAAVRGAGAQPASLGNLVLRSETAAVCSLSLIGGELQVQAAIA